MRQPPWVDDWRPVDGESWRSRDRYAAQVQKPHLDGARATARRVQGSRTYRILVRGGLVAFGIVHLLIGYLAMRLVIGEAPENPSQTGALRELARAPLGTLILWAVSVGFFAIALWQLLTAFVGHGQLEGGLRTRRRWVSLGRFALYMVLGWNALTVALGLNEGNGADTATAYLFSLPFGWFFLVVVGIIVGAVGVALILKGVRDKYEEELHGQLSQGRRWIARVGHVAKGISIVVVGILFLWAAWKLDPEQAGGLDAALQAVRVRPFGAVSLAVIAVGFGCYGIYCFAWARHARFT